MWLFRDTDVWIVGVAMKPSYDRVCFFVFFLSLFQEAVETGYARLGPVDLVVPLGEIREPNVRRPLPAYLTSTYVGLHSQDIQLIYITRIDLTFSPKFLLKFLSTVSI